MSAEQLPDDHFRPTYEDIHVQIGEAARKIKAEFDPDLMVAIGGGGFYPARVLRTFLKKPSALDASKMRNIPIQAIGLSLYEEVSGTSEGQIGNEVVRTQWLDAKTVTGHKAPGKIEEGKDAGGLLGKNVLIVDEVDDSRTTLQYAYSELLKDVKNAIANLSPAERQTLAPTRFAIFVVHNKEKAGGKRGTLPILPKNLAKGEDKIVDGVSEGVRYYATQDTGDVWICYPWEEEYVSTHSTNALFPLHSTDRGAANTCLSLPWRLPSDCTGISSSTTDSLLSPRSSVSTRPTKHSKFLLEPKDHQNPAVFCSLCISSSPAVAALYILERTFARVVVSLCLQRQEAACNTVDLCCADVRPGLRQLCFQQMETLVDRLSTFRGGCQRRK